MRFILFTSILIFFDQISKICIKFYLYNQQLNIIGSFLKFTYIENRGIAFGIDTSNYHIYVTILSILVIIYIIYYYNIHYKEYSLYQKTSFSFLIGGALGNIIDRILVLIPNSGYSGVIDFIDIGFNSYRWYIFNFADIFITIGIMIYLISEYKLDK